MSALLVVQMFNQGFARVEKQLSQLQRWGATHVLISPPQRSHPSRAWWARYQPVDFRDISGPLGNAASLARLCSAAAARGLAVVADTVLNHTTNHPAWVSIYRGAVTASRLPGFAPWDFRAPDGDPGRYRGGPGRPLPDLDMNSGYVLDHLREYLHRLFALGVRGYRFDTAKHLPAHAFAHVLHGLPPTLCFGEMVYGSSHDFPRDTLRFMRAYDFPLAAALKGCFAPGGDLRGLLDPAREGRALPEPWSVPFVNHHDLVKNRRAFDAFRVGDKRDRDLAYVYVLGSGHGVPLVYSGDLRSPEVRAGMRFARLTEGAPRHWLGASPTLLAWSRGRHALAALNKAGGEHYAERLATPLEPGLYQDLISNLRWRVDPAGRLEHFHVPGRGARLLVRRL